MMTTTQELAEKFFKLEPLIVGPGIKTGMPILYESPKDVGADRIVNGIAAYEKYRDSCIIVDFGTATTIDLISKKGEYVGGVRYRPRSSARGPSSGSAPGAGFRAVSRARLAPRQRRSRPL